MARKSRHRSMMFGIFSRLLNRVPKQDETADPFEMSRETGDVVVKCLPSYMARACFSRSADHVVMVDMRN